MRLLIAVVAAAFILAVPHCARAHDQYQDWRQPRTGISCCSGHAEYGDCYPTEAKFENGVWFAQRREDNLWLAIPPEKVLTDGATPDGKAHLCAPKPQSAEDFRVYCFRPQYSGG